MPVVINGTSGITSANYQSTGAIYENAQTITANTTITTSYNALSAGPITIANTITVTIPTGSNWAIV